MIFVDTSALLAILDKDDINYIHALPCWKNLLQQEQAHHLFSNNYILIESITIIQKRLGLQAVQELQGNILPFMHIEWIDENQHDSIVKKVLALNRRRLSLVDCAAFESMRHLGIETVFTFDEHFREQGFTVMPG